MAKVSIDGLELNYESRGAGPPIFFAHGMTGSLHDWENQFRALSSRYRVIAWDCLGHGHSAAPGKEEAYSIDIFARCVHGLLDRLGIKKCCLAGHSMGGFTALQFAMNYPDSLAALVLVDTSSGDFERVPGFDEIRKKIDELAFTKGLEAAWEYNIAHNPQMQERFKADPQQRELSRRKTLQTSLNGYVYVPRTFNHWQPVTPQLGRISVPTIIFRGEEDSNFIKACNVLHDGIHGSKLVIVPGAGHSPHEETPTAFNKALIEFLDRAYPATS